MAHFESLTIFYPMWNEAETIERAVAAAFEAGDALVEAGDAAPATGGAYRAARR